MFSYNLNNPNMIDKVRSLIIIIGCSLIGCNIIGFFIPLRNDEIYQEKLNRDENDISLTYKEILAIINQRSETDELYLKKVNTAINKGVAHYWEDEGIDKYNLRVPFCKNYILYLASYIYPNVYKKYEFYNYKKNLKRGVGLCGIHSHILSGILEENKIENRIVVLPGHIVVNAQIDKERNIWQVADPDLGVIIDKNIYEIEENPSIIKSYYTDPSFNSLISTSNFQKIISIKNGIYECKGGLYLFIDKASYIAIWVGPVLLFIMANFLNSRRKIVVGGELKTDTKVIGIPAKYKKTVPQLNPNPEKNT